MEIYIVIWQSFIFLSIILLLISAISILRSNTDTNKKILWMLTSLFIPFFGPAYYLLIGRK
ncbi:PLD nuclease N-terminal domain-containing protein [Gillisia sp. Q332]|uniref:PLD nuclease N-terminal domain-containing protein n=1 Tax=Gillisia xinjiangensis TaxID=3384765 RepID=UPI00391A7579